jgi:hypothetical protein
VLPEYVDRHAAARIPVAADAQPFRLEQRHQFLADGDGAVLVEGAVVAEAVQIKLERLRLDKMSARHIVDHQMGEVGLTGDRTKTGEFRRGEARYVIRIRVRIGDAVEPGLVGRRGNRAGAAKLQWFSRHRLLMHCLAAR